MRVLSSVWLISEGSLSAVIQDAFLIQGVHGVHGGTGEGVHGGTSVLQDEFLGTAPLMHVMPCNPHAG